jgi:CHAD domain-containing protein
MAKKRKPPAVQAITASAALAAAGAIGARKAIRDRTARRAEARRFRLLEGETAADGVRRVAMAQLDVAGELVEGRKVGPKDVHEARKSLKRARALLRVARPYLPSEVYEHENVTFRDAGRELAGARDARVLLETLEKITPDGESGARARLFARFRERLERDALGSDDPVPRTLAQRLSEARVRVAVLPIPPDGGPELLVPGVERIYRRGREALKRARKHPDSEHRHELRKRAKDLWHAGQLLRSVDVKALRKLRRRAHRLADLLGDDHDLAVLRERALAEPDRFAPGELESLTTLIDRRQADLQRIAMKCAARTYRRKPRKLARQIADGA